MKLNSNNVERVTDEISGFYLWLQETSDEFIDEVESEADTELGN